MATSKQKIKLSSISLLHYVKLIYRALLLLLALGVYVAGRWAGLDIRLDRAEEHPVILSAIWVVFAVEMVLRLFPSKLESMGCQKQFSPNFIPTSTKGTKAEPHLEPRRALAVAGAWFLLNGIIGALYFARIIDEGILLLIALAYSVCDMVCILFFCPFQTWFLKNKCCVACRIYNWDYAMMFTPFLFIPKGYTWSLLAIALILLLRWELAYHRHPQWFSENANAALSCANCTEKLCQHKTQLRRFAQQRLREEKGHNTRTA